MTVAARKVVMKWRRFFGTGVCFARLLPFARLAGAPMKSPPAASPWSGPLLTVVEVAILVSLPFLYWATARQAVSTDPFVYAQTAKELLAGHRLYLDTWQDKPPLVFLFFAIPQLFDPRSYAALSFFLGICLAIQAILFRWTFRSNRVAAFCCLLFVALFPMTNSDFVWLSTEHLSNFFVAGNLLLAFAIYRDRKFRLGQCALAGVLSCLAFHVRQNALFSGTVPLLSILLSGQSNQAKAVGAAVMAGAAVACWGLVLALMASIGDLHGYFYTVFTYPRLYANAGESGSNLDLLLDVFQLVLPILLAILLGLTWGGRYQWLAVGAAIIGVGFCMLPQRPFPHYWANLLPTIALLIGLAMQDPRPGASRIVSSMVIWLAVYVGFLTFMSHSVGV